MKAIVIAENCIPFISGLDIQSAYEIGTKSSFSVHLYLTRIYSYNNTMRSILL